MISPRFRWLTILLMGLVVAFATPVFANHVEFANATATCRDYTICVSGYGLELTQTFRVDYTIILTPVNPGVPITINGSIPILPENIIDINGHYAACQTMSLGPLTQDYTLAGTATLFNITMNWPHNTISIVFNPTETTGCIPPPGGCPGTIGFWKNQSVHPFPSAVQSGGLTIAGVHYSAADLYTILNKKGGDAVTILGKQLVGALLNKAAGGVDNPAADTAITTAEALLLANSLNLLTSSVDPSTTLGQSLIAQATILAGYNNANFSTCSEGAGLILGPF